MLHWLHFNVDVCLFGRRLISHLRRAGPKPKVEGHPVFGDSNRIDHDLLNDGTSEAQQQQHREDG